jgi:hypothetical protein
LYKLTLNKSQDNLRTQELSRKEAKGKGNEWLKVHSATVRNTFKKLWKKHRNYNKISKLNKYAALTTFPKYYYNHFAHYTS